MSRKLEGGVIRFGRQMPLPSDMREHKEMRESVYGLYTLWKEIFRDNINKNDPEMMRRWVNEYFDTLSEDQKDWLEGRDPKFPKTRSLMVKERAMQTVQIASTAIKKRQRRETRNLLNSS